METRDGDTFVVKDDHNHNYRSTRSNKVLLDSKAVPQAICGPVQMGEEPQAQRGKAWTVDLGGSDSGSESSEVSETDCVAMAAMAEGKFTLDSTPKLRKLVYSRILTTGHNATFSHISNVCEDWSLTHRSA